MDILWDELFAGFSDSRDFARIAIRLVAALILGAVVGFQRGKAGKPAGLRTHILVSLGTTLFIISCTSVNMGHDALSRVIQGITTGVGFIGAGAILKKQREKLEVHGLTTAAGVWMTSALGVAVGLGRIGIAIFSVILAWIVLSVLGYAEARVGLA
jgi:putative Mg2+ transporter-C (MgtC) family protein